MSYIFGIYWNVYVDFYLLYDTSISALLLQTK